MGRGWKLGLAALVVVAVAVPATVIARGGADTLGNADAFSTEVIGKTETQGKGYHPLGLFVPATISPITITVSAQMTKGKAKFRVVSPLGGAGVYPGSVVFSAPGSNSFTFAAQTGSCPPLELEWKRVGDKPAKAAKIATFSVYDSDKCV